MASSERGWTIHGFRACREDQINKGERCGNPKWAHEKISKYLGGIPFGYSVPLSLEGRIAPGKHLKTAEVS